MNIQGIAFPERLRPESRRFGFLLVPNFSLIALSSAVDPLRLANMALGRTVFDYVTIGLAQEPVMSSDGISVLPSEELGRSSQFDAVFVVGPNPIPRRGDGEIVRWLRQLAARGIVLGGIDTGSVTIQPPIGHRHGRVRRRPPVVPGHARAPRTARSAWPARPA